VTLEFEAAFVFGSVKGLFLSIKGLFLSVKGLFLSVKGLFLSVKGLFLRTGFGIARRGCVNEDTSTLISPVTVVIETADLVTHRQVLH
jgi:hypothetical protein